MARKYGKIIKYICFTLFASAIALLFVWAVKSELIPIIDLSAPAREEFDIKTEDEILDDLLSEGDVSAIVQNEYEKYMASLPKATYGFENTYVKGETSVVFVESSYPAPGQNRPMPEYTGESVLPSGYTCVGFEDGVLLLARNGKHGYYSEDGYWVTAPDYEEAYAFSGGLAVVKKDGLYGVIDREGETIVPFLFDGIGDLQDNGMIVYKKGDGYSRIALVKFEQNNRK